MHECPRCGLLCDCEKGSEVLTKCPDLTSDELKEDECTHECDEDEAE